MKIKRSAIAVALIALVLAVLLAVPMVLPAAAEVTYYANNTFEDMALGAYTYKPTSQAIPSKATVIDYGGNKVVKLETVPADPTSSTEISSGGANVDKNLIVKNDQISYTTEEAIVLQAKYFISADAEGTFQSQFLTFTSTASVSLTSYLDLYMIDLSSGKIFGQVGSGSGTVTKGAWNTVKMVLNLKTAAYRLYVNNALVTDSYLNRGVTAVNLTLDANNWIIAKLNKSCTSYAGYVLIDDATIMPAAYEEETYAQNDFEHLPLNQELTDANNQGTTAPSLAEAIDDNGSRVIKLQTVPATKAGTTTAEYVVIGSTSYAVTDGAITYNDVSYPVVDGKVTIGGTTYSSSTDAREKEIRVGGSNVDKNILASNSTISYETADKVYLRVEYYISDDAEGRVQSQFMSFSYVDETGATQSKTWKSLYYLNLGSGMISTDYKTSDTDVLRKGAWNTVTTVIDLNTSYQEIYVNERLVLVDDTCAHPNLTLAANRWIIAKLNKSCESYAGYILIDNATGASFIEETCQYVPDATNANGDKLWYVDITMSNGETVRSLGAGEKYFSAGGATFKPVYFDDSEYEGIVAPVTGASIRLSHAAGIRFATQLDLDTLNSLLALEEQGLVSKVSFGTMIAPMSYISKADGFTMEEFDAAGLAYLNVKGTVGYYYGVPAGVTLESGMDTCFVGSITNVKLGNRSIDFSAIGYVQVKFFNGGSAYIYSYDADDYDDATFKANYARSVKCVADKALEDPNANWTADERVILQSLFEGATKLNLSSSAIIKDVQYTSSEFFFRNAAGVYCRLTYEGANGWRLQANAKSYDGFDEMGAGQALAAYLGEVVGDKTQKLTVTYDSSKVKLQAAGTSTYVTLNYTGSFNMQFYTETGTLVSNVSSIAISNTATNTSDKAVELKGSLVSGEAVYGGGERFDTVNQRGNAFQLYTRDGWNNGTSSYMAIPLFVTSRGAGMFINRYENMAVDFGKDSSDVWSVTLNNNLMDCYFYATGKISDALFGYTEISGHSSLPEEWAQGELICRYSPDLSSFEDREEYTNGYAKYTDIPVSDYNSRGVKAIAFSSYKNIPNYTNYYVKSNWSSSYTKLTSNTGSFLHDLNKLYTDDTGSTVAYVKLDNNYYALGKTWATLAEANAFGVSEAYDWSYLFQLTTSDGAASGVSDSYAACYYLADDGLYYKAGPKGNPGGLGVKSVVTNLINAGMKPTAMVMEAFGWSNISTNAARYAELKETVEWLDELGIKSMFYMGVGALSGNMLGYKSEYQVWATKTYTDGTTEKIYQIPKTSGTGENPDVGTSSTQQYIDVTNPQAVDWYMNEIWGMMIDLGVDGIKIDFCECMPDEGTYGDYTLNYNWYDDSVFEGDEVHHAYSTYFISIFYKSMLEQKAAKNIPDGFVVLSRGGGIGSQRNPYLWEGDQTRTFEKIEDQLIALINSGISGVPFMTYDMAGYAYAASGAQITGAMTLEEESRIFARAIEYTAFTSTIQTHGDVRHAFEMTEETQEIYRNYTDLHEQLIPYIQKYSQEACDTGMPVVRHMILQYQNDANVYDLKTQYMFGAALLVAPITTDNTTSKDVYLPEGTWLNMLTGETVTGGRFVTVSASLSQIPVFMNTECSAEDQNLLADVFNGETWKEISGIQFNIEKVNLKGDPWGEDPFEEADPFLN